MFTFRETYADVACILTLQLSYEQYKNAFAKSIQFKYDANDYFDYNKELREILVARAVIRFLPEDIRDSWLKSLQKPNGNRRKNREKKTEISYVQDTSQCAIIPVIASSRNLFDQYFSLCGGAFSERLEQIEGIDIFRQEVKGILENESQQEQLLRILGGMDKWKD